MIYEKIRDVTEEPLVFYTNHAVIAEHHHSSIELAYVITGEALISVDGKEYRLSEGQFAVIGSNLVHSYLRQKGLCMVVLLPLVSLAPFRSTLLGSYFTPCVFSDTPDGFVKTLFDTLEKLLKNRPTFSEQTNKPALVQSIVDTFMTFVFGRMSFVKKTDRSLPDTAMIYDYLQLNYTHDINTSLLAKHFGYTEKHITAIVRCLCGMSLKDYVYMLRINEAKRLLLEDMTLDEISARVGFSCTRTFLRSFVKITGKTPNTYKTECRAGTSMLPNDMLYVH